MRALLAEADASVRSHLHAALIQRGWRVTAVRSGAEAIARFRATPFPMVVVAHRLPDADGLEICRIIRGSTLGRAAYLLVTLPTAVPEVTRPLVEAGVDDFLSTPLIPAHLAMRLAFAECRLAMHPGDPQGEAPTVSYPERIAELEHALRVEQASLQELFESAPEGIVVVDEHDRIVRANSEFSRMFGYAPEEALGRTALELIVPEHLRDEGRRVTRGVVGGERVTLETQRRRRDGKLLDVSVLATPIRVGDGSIGAYGLYRDISERKAQERALRESEARYRALFDQSPVGVFLCGPDLRVTHCNERLAQILGIPTAALVGASLHEADRGALLPGLGGASVDAPAFYEGPHGPPGGESPLWIVVHYVPLRDSDGRVIGGMGVVEDITERERAEQQLRAQAAELERVNAALRERTLELEEAMQTRNRLYTAMNHELRTPISAVMLYQELLLTGAMGELSPDQSQALERSYTAARHLLELVCDILDLSKLEAGKVTVHPSEVPLPELLRDLLDTVLPLAQRYGSEIRVEIAPEFPPLVTDPQRLRQILLNLVSNAAKFGRGRPIEIRAHRSAPGEVVVQVADEGVGIEAADQQRIFEDFVQVGDRQEEGTGLGLAISRRLARLLQGRLEVRSEPGVGSTFSLLLPCALPRAERAKTDVAARRDP